MTGLSRRVLLKRGGIGAAAAGFISAVPALPARAETAQNDTSFHRPAGPAATGPLVVHIPDPRTGEIYFLVGNREVVRHDPALVAQLLRDAG
jgi:hypothetical protein